MEAELMQALLEMNLEQKMLDQDSYFERNNTKEFSHVNKEGKLPPIVNGTRPMKRREVERELAPMSVFLDKKEPPMRDARERMAVTLLQKPSANWARVDDQAWPLQTERINPQQAYLDSRKLPPNGYKPEFTKTIEFGRTPNATERPVQPFTEERFGREVAKVTKRAPTYEKGYAGAAVNEYGPDEWRLFHETAAEFDMVPKRNDFLESQLSHQFRREDVYRPEDALALRTVNGLRLKKESDLDLLTTRLHAGGRDDWGDLLIPNMVQQERKNVVIDQRLPGKTKLGEAPQDQRAHPFGLEATGRREVDATQEMRAPVLFPNKDVLQFRHEAPEHLVAALVDMVGRRDELYPGRQLERDDLVDDLQTIVLRSNPYHVSYV